MCNTNTNEYRYDEAFLHFLYKFIYRYRMCNTSTNEYRYEEARITGSFSCNSEINTFEMILVYIRGLKKFNEDQY